MDFDFKTLFAYVRKAPFGGRLTQQQIDGLRYITTTFCELCSSKDLRHLAYVLATVFHETGGTMMPVREGFAKSDRAARKVVAHRTYGKPDPATGHVYYGRGYVQLTWAGNYDTLGKVLGIDLLNNPDLALDPKISAQILIEGMTRGTTGRGDFTGKSVEDYFDGNRDDPLSARRIINGTDKARLIADYHRSFLEALKAAELSTPLPTDVKDSDAKADGTPLAKDKTTLGAVTSILGAGGAGLLTGIDNPWALAAVLVVGIGVVLFLTGRLEIRRSAGA